MRRRISADRGHAGPRRRGPALALAFGVLALAWAIPVLAAVSPPAAADDPVLQAENRAIGGPFTLLDQDGRTVTEATWRGKWMLVYFGYTNCPDACPMALANIAAARDALDPGLRARIQPIFVTVDPARDTPAVLKAYVGAFAGADIAGLTGTPAQVAAIEAAYRVHARRHDEGNGEYSVEHSSVIDIMDPEGRFAGIVSGLMPPERLAARLVLLMR